MTDTPKPATLHLGFFENFETVAGLLKDSGARRTDSRDFALDRPMTPAQVVALLQLLQYSRADANTPVRLEVPRLDERAYAARSEELYAWWGTIDKKPWLAEPLPEGGTAG
ncbi:hypothetical protein [Streptomyces sp. NPDC096351]|uniref:hypothetical protein n=1 Tax=Streptomyces sp. NPDC096351 TaxID=3366087 RepID=UPI00381AA785